MNLRRVTGFAIAAAAAAVSAPLAAQNVAITNATLATGDGSEPVENATVVVQNGKIVAAGPGVAAPAGMAVIDGTGKWVTPGLFAAMTQLGLYDVDGVPNSNDSSGGRSIFSAALDVTTALNPASQHVSVTRGGGITRASVFVGPSSAIFGGQGAVVDLGADPNMVMRPRAFQVVTLGESGGRIAGGTRLAAQAAFRNALQEAQTAVGKTDRPADALLNRPDALALVPVVRGEQPLYVAVERAADIRSVLALRNDFPKLDLVIVGASEGWMVASELAAAKVPVIAHALDDLPTSFEDLAATQSNVGRMVRAGVKVAVGGLTGGTGDQARNSKQFAGNLVALNKLPGATGLTWGQALATISSVPAEIAGFGGKAGVLKPGAVGDVVLWDGDPLELASAPVKVFIDGVEQPTDNHQTKLRERYRDLDTSQLPKAYEW
ncbi:amidohydrolase family protein [Tsuneonella suprasediminis]|uniref:amidohydrolase family protein n=1 Tax=Tsuneonella suprasediminis TaxID=2306996 RepID=UPI00196A7F20|nr:amidohydrolase family protein [Tsuneonella suprasediminis]